MRKMVFGLVVLASALWLAACATKGTLDNSSVENVRVEGRLFEVRIAPTNIENEYRMMIVRATLVIEPDPEREYERARNIANRYFERTCRGRPYKVLEDRLVDKVNFYTRFRCSA